jgi:guanyl-specific ribonuclease Sa
VKPSSRVTLALVGLVALVLVGWTIKDSTATTTAPSGKDTVALSSLPSQAADTWKLIQSDGPFPYPRNDGVVFGNREGLLPQHNRGYYHEYTVPTPGSSTRGARRIITGDGTKQVYYTGDHYKSFSAVDTNR